MAATCGLSRRGPGCLRGVGLVAVDFPGGGAGDDGDSVDVDEEGELVVLGDHGNGLAGVDHADVDFLGGDHDAAREETRRWTVTAGREGRGRAGAARAAQLRSLPRGRAMWSYRVRIRLCFRLMQ